MALVPPPGLRGSQCPVRRQRLSHTNGGQRNPRSLLATFVRRWQTSQTQVVVQEIYIIEFLSYGSTFKRTEVKKGDRNSRSGNEAQEPLAELRKIYFPISYFIALNSLSKILTTVRRDKQWGVVYQKRDTLEALQYGYSWFPPDELFQRCYWDIFEGFHKVLQRFDKFLLPRFLLTGVIACVVRNRALYNLQNLGFLLMVNRVLSR